MALIKVLKFSGGIATEVNSTADSIQALSFRVGGPSGTDLTKAILDTLSAGPSSDASSLHSHDSRYYTKSQYINASTGVASAALPINTDSRGKFDPSFYVQSDITHGNLSGLSADDHPQYFNQTRGDARYYPQTSFVSVSAGVSSAGAPVKLNASGQIDSSMINSASANHEALSGLLGGSTGQHYHLTQTEHDGLTTSIDASFLHNHNTQYYTKLQIDAQLLLKANDNIVIKKDGSVAFTADQPMGGHKITGIADGTVASDASSYGQMQAAVALKVSKAGDTMSGNLDMGGNRILNLSIPSVGTDAVNKNYVDNKITGISWRPSAQLKDVVDTTRPTSTATLIDGVTVTSGLRVLFTSLTTTNNQIYVASVVSTAVTWTLATDGMSGTGAPAEGDAILITEGTSYTDTAWVYNTQTTNAWTQFNGAGSIQAGTGLSKLGNTLSVNLGAGITELSTGSVGIDIKSDGALILVDPTTGLPSSTDSSQLAVKLADATLTKSTAGLAVGVIQTANIAALAITTAKIAAQAVTQTQLGNLSVGTAQLIDANVTTVKILDANVTGAKLASNTAGAGLAQNAGTKALDVQFDNTSIDLNGSNQVEVKALGITTAKIAALAVDSTKVLFGTTGTGVNASLVPVIDTANHFVTKNVEAALNELANASYIIAETSGEAIGQGDLVAVRRDSGNTAKVYKASAAGSDNVVAASVVFQDITYTGVNSIFFSGNAITVTYVNPSVINAALSVTVSGNAITVNLATNGSGSITSTATQIIAAVQATTTATALATPTLTGIGSNIQTAQAATSLSNGVDYNDNSRWEIYGVALDAAAAAGTSIRIRKFGKLTCSFAITPTAANIGQSVYLSINRGKAAFGVSSTTLDSIVYIGRLVSTTEVEFKCSVLRNVNG